MKPTKRSINYYFVLFLNKTLIPDDKEEVSLVFLVFTALNRYRQKAASLKELLICKNAECFV